MAQAREVSSPVSVEGTDGLRALRALRGVEAIFRSRDGRVLYAVTREHDAIDSARLLEVERELQEAGDPEVTIAVCAHQGRDPRAMFEGFEELAMTQNLSDRRQVEKQASRDADELALAQGVSAKQIEAKNSFVLAERTIVHWDRSKHL